MDDDAKLNLWIKRMRRCIKDFPSGYWLFAADGNLYLMKRGSDGQKVMTNFDGYNQDYIVTSFRGPDIDGGDW